LRSRLGSIVACSLVALVSTLFIRGGVTAGSPGPGEMIEETDFVVRPYLQLGDALPGKGIENLSLLWQSAAGGPGWGVEYRSGQEAWREADAPKARRIEVPSIVPHWLYRAVLVGLVPGSTFTYRVRKEGNVVFSADGRSPKKAGQVYRFAVFGDCGAGTSEQKKVAYQTHLAQPDFVMITGDIVYSRGRISEYREKYWTIYNSDEPSPLSGAPLLRSILFVAAPGNHDIAIRDLDKYPDALAYYLYWDQPRNGPLGTKGGPLVPLLSGRLANQQAFLAAAGESYPRMANFSFDYGGAHWTVLDSNPYVDWTNRDLRAWVQRDLAAARGAAWRFVAFHHPGFNSSKAHFNDQQMRLLADLFEAGGVDVVFAGHVHNYQRTLPLRFTADVWSDGRPVRDQDRVPGQWILDKHFDGQSHTHPEGVIYLVTGAGGNRLYNPEQQDDPNSWQSFTTKFISKVNSLTLADVSGTTLTVRQVSDTGIELDRFVVTK